MPLPILDPDYWGGHRLRAQQAEEEGRWGSEHRAMLGPDHRIDIPQEAEGIMVDLHRVSAR